MAGAFGFQFAAHQQDFLYLPWRKLGWVGVVQALKIQAVASGAHSTESQVRVKGLQLLTKSERGKGETDRGLEVEQLFDGAFETDPDEPGPFVVGEAAEPGHAEREWAEPVAGSRQTLDDRVGLVGGDVTEETEGQMDLVWVGPVDLTATRGRAELSLN
jgi:hypothetical protein